MLMALWLCTNRCG